MLKALFAGSPQCAEPSLESLSECAEIVGILTAPPAAKKRSSALIPSDIETAARKLKEEGKIAQSVPVLSPEKITDTVREEIAALKPDILICFAYGKIFSEKTLSLFPKGAFNIHPSLLPRWRGPSPVQAAILARDKETGVTIQRMAAEVDAGDIAAQATVALDGTENASELLERLSILAASMLPQVISSIENGTLKCTPQSGEPVFCRLIEKKDGEIDWNASAEEIDARVRAFSPWPGAFTRLSNGKGVLFIRKAKVYQGEDSFPKGSAGAVHASKSGIFVRCGSGILSIERLQRETKAEMDFAAFFNGNKGFFLEQFNCVG